MNKTTNAVVVVDDSIIDMIECIEAEKKQIAEISTHKAELENEVKKLLNIKDTINTHSQTIVYGSKKCKISTQSSIKIEDVDAFREIAPDLIDVKYECNKSRYAKLLESDPALVNKANEFLVIKPNKPTFTF